MSRKFSDKWLDLVKLTKEQYENGGFHEYYDSGSKGLSLRVGKRSKTYYVQNASTGVKRTKIGSTTTISLDQARKLSDDLQKLSSSSASTTRSYKNMSIRDYAETVYKAEHTHIKDLDNLDYIDDLLMSKSMLNVKKSDVENWVQRRIREVKKDGSTVKPATARRNYNCLRSLFRFAVDQGHIPFSTVSGVKISGIDQGFRRKIATEDLKVISAAILKSNSPFLKLLFQLMLLTGARPKELLNSKQSDFEYEYQTLTVPASFSKTGKTRTITLSHSAINVLDAHYTSDFFNQKCRENNPKEYYFWNNNQAVAKPVGSVYRSYSRIIKSLLAKGKIKQHYTMYQLRHTFATEILREHDIETARALLGHADIRTTQIYISTDTVRRAEATESVSEKYSFVDDVEMFDIEPYKNNPNFKPWVPKHGN